MEKEQKRERVSINFRADKAEKDIWLEFCKEKGMTFSEFIRRSMWEYISNAD